MEEAQRRANIQRGAGLPHSQNDEDRNTNTNIKIPESPTSPKSPTSPTSPKPESGRIARFVKRNLRGLRRRSYPPYHSSDALARSEAPYKDETTRPTGRPQPIGDATKKREPKVEVKSPQFRGQSGTNAGFSPIAVKYWPKIMEDKEEEPPEALQFDHDSSWGLSKEGTTK